MNATTTATAIAPRYFTVWNGIYGKNIIRDDVLALLRPDADLVTGGKRTIDFLVGEYTAARQSRLTRWYDRGVEIGHKLGEADAIGLSAGCATGQSVDSLEELTDDMLTGDILSFMCFLRWDWVADSEEGEEFLLELAACPDRAAATRAAAAGIVEGMLCLADEALPYAREEAESWFSDED